MSKFVLENLDAIVSDEEQMVEIPCPTFREMSALLDLLWDNINPSLITMACDRAIFGDSLPNVQTQEADYVETIFDDPEKDDLWTDETDSDDQEWERIIPIGYIPMDSLQ